MIHTGLPYDFDQMEKIRESGAIIDMSDVSFPGISKEEQSKTVFIFLRNTGFDQITLDFSNCSYTEKEDILDEYLTTGFDVALPELIEGAREVLYTAVSDQELSYQFFTKEEAKKFYAAHKNLCDEIIDIIASSFLFVIKTTTAFKDASVDDTAETKYVGANLSNLFQMKGIEEFMVLLFEQQHPIHYYTDIFKLENHSLYEAVHESTMLPAILFGLGEKDPEEWEAAFEKLEKEGENK